MLRGALSQNQCELYYITYIAKQIKFWLREQEGIVMIYWWDFNRSKTKTRNTGLSSPIYHKHPVVWVTRLCCTCHYKRCFPPLFLCSRIKNFWREKIIFKLSPNLQALKHDSAGLISRQVLRHHVWGLEISVRIDYSCTKTICIENEFYFFLKRGSKEICGKSFQICL